MPKNWLDNGNFEKPWYHPVDKDGNPIREFQIVEGWEFWWCEGTGDHEGNWLATPSRTTRLGDSPINPYDAADHSRFQRPEIRVMLREQVPDWEEEMFGMEGDHILKPFARNRSLYLSFSQAVDLEPGEYQLTIRVYPDVVMGYDGSEKVFADDPNAALIQFGVDGNASGWQSINPVTDPPVPAEDRLQVVTHAFTVEQAGRVELEIVFMLPFPLVQNGLFCDRWMLERVDEPESPPTGDFPYGVFRQGSRLGTHNIARANDKGDILAFLSAWTAGGSAPPVIKAVDHFGWVEEARRECPDSVIVGRVTSGLEGCETVERPDTDLTAMADDLITLILDKIAVVPGLENWVDYWEPCNEPDPPGAFGYAQLARLMIECMDAAEYHGIKLALFSLNAGTPEWDEMEAMVETGVFERAKNGGHILSLHEGVFGDQPIDHWWPDPIPGAPEVEDAGALCFRYRYLYHLLEQRNAVVPLILSEFRTHGANHPISNDEIVQRFAWYDERARQDYYVWGVCPFTLGATGQWYPSHDYGPVYTDLIRYALSIKDEANALGPGETEPPPSGWVPGPRVLYKRHSVLLPQGATLKHWLEAAARAYDKKRSLSFSADDVALFGPSERTVELDGFPATGPNGVEAHREFFDRFYPGMVVLEHGTVGNGPPPPPPPPPVLGAELLCPHVQSGLDEVLDYVGGVEPASCKVFVAEWAREIVARSPNTKVIWRNWWSDYDQFVYADDKHEAAVFFLGAQWDSLLANRDWIWGIEGVNEHMAEWLPETVSGGVEFALALCDVLEERNRDHGTDFALVPLNLAVGAMGPVGAGAILHLVERLCELDWPLGLHSYWKVESGVYEGPDDSWLATAGRFELMDEVFARHNLKPTYAFTEAGPCLWAGGSGGDWVRPTQGWRTCHGSIGRYLPHLLRFRELVLESDVGKEGRAKLASLFTTHPGGDWPSWDHRKEEWGELARVLEAMR